VVEIRPGRFVTHCKRGKLFFAAVICSSQDFNVRRAICFGRIRNHQVQSAFGSPLINFWPYLEYKEIGQKRFHPNYCRYISLCVVCDSHRRCSWFWTRSPIVLLRRWFSTLVAPHSTLIFRKTLLSPCFTTRLCGQIVNFSL